MHNSCISNMKSTNTCYPKTKTSSISCNKVFRQAFSNTTHFINNTSHCRHNSKRLKRYYPKKMNAISGKILPRRKTAAYGSN